MTLWGQSAVKNLTSTPLIRMRPLHKTWLDKPLIISQDDIAAKVEGLC